MVLLKIYEKQDLPENLSRLILISLAEAIESYERRIIVLSGEKNHETFLSPIVKNIALNLLNFFNKINVLYVSEDFSENTEWGIRYRKFIEKFEEIKDIEIRKIRYKESTKVMGQTYEILILDMLKSLTPDDIGKLIGVVRGGGMIIILSPSISKWKNIKTTFHEHLLTPPYTLDDTKNRFLRRFVRKILEHEGIYIYDIDKKEIVKKPLDMDRNLNVSFPSYKPPELPPETIFDKKIYKLAISEDQKEVIKIIENSLKEQKFYFVLTADRGRGKSAAIGLALAGIVGVLKRKKRFDIGITAPEFTNVKVLFEFLIRGLRAQKIEYEIDKDKKRIRIGKIFIEYKKPLELVSRNYDIVAVDEAAGININMLYRIIEKFNKVIFSTTTHGYEGAGRTFTVRFLNYLKEKKGEYVKEYKMKIPIRYASSDPIEKWLFDALVLDAEPAEIENADYELVRKKEIEYEIPDLDEWFDRNDYKLKQFVGIYILAHYKNRPNDVAMVADAPHHDARVLKLKNGKIVNALQIAYEGGIPENVIKQMLKKYKPKGNVIPDVITKHYRRKDFAKLKGIRIVRIATHPDLQRMGLGSIALKELENEVKGKFSWIGAGFGATIPLLRFWQKNGYVVVHISPERNPVSGEYSVIVLKPLDSKAEKIIREINYEFRWRFLNSITDVFFDIEPELALQILDTPYEFKPHFRTLLTLTQQKRLKAYFTTAMTYEAAADVVRLISLYYFTSTEKDKPKLEDIEEKVLFSKIFMAWSFKKISNYFDIKIGKARLYIKRASKKIYKWLKEKGMIEFEE